VTELGSAPLSAGQSAPNDEPPCVLNKKHLAHIPEGAVYIGRAVKPLRLRRSKWANPFVIGRHGTREEVVAKYREWIVQQPELMASLHELRGRDLVCWCAPNPCHGDVLLELANSEGVR
jgi:hypothetical protein